jgi:hypothetical protein
MKAPKVVTGMFGEFVVARELEGLDYQVQWSGGLCVGGDMRAERKGRRLWIQVKASTVSDGRIAYQKTPEDLDRWVDAARQEDREPWFAFVHFPDQVDTQIDGAHERAMISVPKTRVVTAVAADEFSRCVERARDEYASRLRQRPGRNGEAIGDPLPRAGLRYPVVVDDFDPIGRALTQDA